MIPAWIRAARTLKSVLYMAVHRGILGWDWVLCILCPHAGKQVQGACGKGGGRLPEQGGAQGKKKGSDRQAWTHTFNPQVMPGLLEYVLALIEHTVPALDYILEIEIISVVLAFEILVWMFF